MSAPHISTNVFPEKGSTFDVEVLQTKTPPMFGAPRSTTLLTLSHGVDRFVSLFLSTLTTEQLAEFGRKLEDVGTTLQDIAFVETEEAEADVQVTVYD
jgi:hypothetical protein